MKDLIRLARMDLGPAPGDAVDLDTPTEDKTCLLIDTPDEQVLTRLYFDCVFRCHR